MLKICTATLLTILIAFSQLAFAKKSKVKSTPLCASSELYECKVVNKHETWKTLFPDDAERNKIMKINRMNTSLYAGQKIAIPRDDDAALLDLSPFPRQIDAPGQKVIKVSLDKLAFGAYDPEGNLVNWGPVSGGQGYCPDVRRRCRTVTGTFAIYHKGGAGCRSTRYPVGRGGAPMPYCMFFHGNFALHGSPNVPGYNASHGCVRMFTKDAEWLNKEFTSGSRVKVIVN